MKIHFYETRISTSYYFIRAALCKHTQRKYTSIYYSHQLASSAERTPQNSHYRISVFQFPFDVQLCSHAARLTAYRAGQTESTRGSDSVELTALFRQSVELRRVVGIAASAHVPHIYG